MSPAEDETGRRLKRAERFLDHTFLLLYCDNYWPLNLDKAWATREATGTPLQITVYRNRDGRTRDNLLTDERGFVVAYDKSRATPGLLGVDIGFALVDRSIVAALPQDNISFEAYTYPRAVAARTLSAFATDHRYYSIGSLERLEETARFLQRTPTVLLDRDGVLNRKMARAAYVCDWSQWQWMPGALEALARLRDNGYRTIIATNQPGIARGHLSIERLESIHDRMRMDVRAAGGDIAKISRRDLAAVIARGGTGATTVAGTVLCAAAAGIAIMATGGIGGVHRGGETSLDISADLSELARSPVAVVCSGAKSILDLPRTLEVLETNGVPVAGYGTSTFPAFFSASSGLSLEIRVDGAGAAAGLIRAHRALPGAGGIVIANPVPHAAAIPAETVDRWIEAALAAAHRDGIAGKAVTPFLLKALVALSAGATLNANVALLVNNAAVAADIAVALAEG